MAYLARHVEPERFCFWEDYADGMEPSISVPATGIEDLNDPIRKWPLNDPDYNLFRS